MIGLPLTFWIFNRIPTVLTLRPRRLATTTTVSADGSQMAVVQSPVRQPAFWKRVLYFIFVGWWFSAFWIAVAWVLAVLIVSAAVRGHDVQPPAGGDHPAPLLSQRRTSQARAAKSAVPRRASRAIRAASRPT